MQVITIASAPILLLSICVLSHPSPVLGKLLKRGHDTVGCPCSDVKLCDRVNVPDRQEVVAYAQVLTHYKKFDWNKITTIVVYESYLKSTGMGVVCLAHSFKTRVIIAAAITPDELKNKTARKAVIEHYIGLSEKFFLDGANIDFEKPTIDPALRNGLTAYAEELKAAFASLNPSSIVVADVFWLPNIFHNTTGLVDACDFLFVMSYDEQVDMLPPCVARANAPYAQTQFGITAFLALGVPAWKLVLGTPWYGYLYNCTKLTEDNLCFIDKVDHRCTQTAGVEIDYKVIMNLPDAGPARQWNPVYKSPFRNYKNTVTGVISQIWYDDPESLNLKYQLASKWNLRGVGMWHADALNYTDPIRIETTAMWNALPDY